MKDDASQDKDQQLAERAEKLEQALAEHQPKLERETETLSAKLGNSQALRLSSEFVSGIIIGILLGLAVDYIFSTTPWGIVIFLFLGFCAGVLNVLRAVGRVAPSAIDKLKKTK